MYIHIRSDFFQDAREGNLPKWLMGWSRIISTLLSEGNRAKPMGSACTGSNPVVVVRLAPDGSFRSHLFC